MLSAIFNIIMYEECKNQWSMSRPLLGLILLNEEVSESCVHKIFICVTVLVFPNTKGSYCQLTTARSTAVNGSIIWETDDRRGQKPYC